MSDLRKIDFTITEVPGKFITTPEVATAIGIDIDNGPGEYVCTACTRPIGQKTLMFLDMQEIEKGWRHLKPCHTVDEGAVRAMAKRRVAAAYAIAKTRHPKGNAEEQLMLANTLLATTKGIDKLKAELLTLEKPNWWKEDEASWKKFQDSL